MNSDLYFDAKKYISAGRAAEISGYSADYIGQLCRAKNLECKMIGRNWFVSESSLMNYLNSSSSKNLKNQNESLSVSNIISGISSSIHKDKTGNSGEISFSRDEKNTFNRNSEFIYAEDKGPLIPEILPKKEFVEINKTEKISYNKKSSISLSANKTKSPIHKNTEYDFRKMLGMGAAFAFFVLIVFGGFGALKDFPLVREAREKISFLPINFLKGIMASDQIENEEIKIIDFKKKAENKILALVKKMPIYFEAGLSSSVDGVASAYHSLAGKFDVSFGEFNFAGGLNKISSNVSDKNKSSLTFIYEAGSVFSSAPAEILRFSSLAREKANIFLDNAKIALGESYSDLKYFSAATGVSLKNQPISSISDFSLKIYDGAGELFSKTKNYFAGFFAPKNKFANNEIIPIKQPDNPNSNISSTSNSVAIENNSSSSVSRSFSGAINNDRVKKSIQKKNDFVVASDITRREVLDLIKQFDDSSKALIYAGFAANGENSLIVNQTVSDLKNKINSLEQKESLVPRQLDHVYNSMSRSFSEITSLDGVTMTNSSFSGTTGTFTGLFTGAAGTFSGNLTVGSQLAVSGTATSTIAGDANFDSGTFYVDSLNNRVGVGTTSPTDTLSLNGPLYLASVSTPATTAGRLYNVSSDLYWNGNLVGSASVGNWTLSGGNVYRSSGSVGIGTTSPYARLSVEGSSALGNSALAGYFTATSTTATSTFAGKFAVGTSTPGASSLFTVGTSTPLLHVDNNSGFLGLGTSAPSQQLEITGNLRLPASTASAGIIYSGADTFIHNFGTNNTFMGEDAGNLTTTGSGGNTGVGDSTLDQISTGYNNSAVGVSVLLNNTTGYRNSALGVYALNDNQGGFENSAFGAYALNANTSADYNSAFGSYALFGSGTSIADNNSAFGAYALYDNYGGINNSAFGFKAGYALSGGDYNILFGYQAGDNLTTGSNNLIIGYDIDAPLATGSNQMSIGNLIFGTGINGTGTTVSSGNIGIGTTSPYSRLSVEGSSALGNSALAGYFIATTSTASVFPYASTTAVTVSGSAYIGSLNGPLQANNGLVSATTSVGYQYGGTGLTSTPSFGQLLRGTGSGYALVATSTLGVALSDTTGTLAASRGGTGVTTFGGTNSLLYTTSADVLSSIAAGTGGYILGMSGGAPAWLATSTLADITGTLSVAKGGTGQTSFGQGWLNSDGTTLTSSTSPTVAYITATSTTATSTFAGGLAVETSGLVYDYSTNNVGIGTASPTEALDVTGNIKLSGVLTASNRIRAWTGTVGAPTFAEITDTDTGLYLEGSNILSLVTSGSRRLTIDANGLVGIGTTSPYARLSVEGSSVLGNSALAGYFTATTTTATSTFAGKFAVGTSTPGASSLFTIGTSTPFLHVDNNSGFLGLGTSAPSQQLEITGNFRLPTSTTTAGIIYSGTDTFIHNFGTDNNFVGEGAGNLTTTGTGGNNAFGRQALRIVSTGFSNNAFGHQTLFQNTTGIRNDAFGLQSLYTNTTGNDNVGIGWTTSFWNQTGSYNTVVGSGAGTGVSGNSYSRNTLIGYVAGYTLTTGSNNLLFGYAAGDAITTGSNNLIIGYNIDAPSATGSNQLSIGNLIFGTGIDGTGTTISTGNIGVATTTPSARLHIVQADAADSFRVDDAASDTSPFVIDQNGNVGVGTGAPGASLDAAGRMRVFSTGASPSVPTSGVGIELMYYEGVADRGRIYSYDRTASSYKSLWIDGSDLILQSQSNGLVGVSTAGPDAKLDVLSTTEQLRLTYTDGTVYSSFTVNSAGDLTIVPTGGDANITGNLAVTGTMSAATTTLATTTLSGPLLFSPDNTHDIGASGATRPRTGYYGTSLVVGSTATLTTNALNFSATSTIDLANTALNIDSNTLYVDAANNRVGIGTATPNQQLEITGNFRLPTSTTTAGIIYSGTDRFIHNFGTDNFFAGVNAGNLTMTGSQNVGVGENSLSSLTTGYDNLAFGKEALQYTTTGYQNMAVGTRALQWNYTGLSNVAVGTYALLNNSLGGSGGNTNTAIGVMALDSNNSGSNNTGIGYLVLESNTSGSNNIALGLRAGDNITTGSNNLIIGYDIDAPSATGSNQLSLGNLIFGTGIDGTGTTVSTGNIGIGTANPGDRLHISESDSATTTILTSLRQERLTSGTAGNGLGVAQDFYLEDSAGNSNQAARIDVAWEDATNASEDASIRFNTMQAGTLTEAMRIDDSGYIGIGTNAPNQQLEITGNLRLPTSTTTAGIIYSGADRFIHNFGTDNFFAGVSAGNLQLPPNNFSGANSTMVGYHAGYDIRNSANNNTGFGHRVFEYFNSPNSLIVGGTTTVSADLDENIAIGNEAMVGGYGSHNIAIGINSMAAVKGAASNTVVGNDAMGGSTSNNPITGSGNTAIGSLSMNVITSGIDNVVVGRNGLYSLTSGYFNVGVGNNTLKNLTTGRLNTAIGEHAGFLATGDGNTLLGYQAGDAITTGSNNLIIGYDIDAPLATGSNQMSIGNLIFGTGIDGTGTTISTGKIGIATAGPDAKLDVLSTTEQLRLTYTDGTVYSSFTVNSAGDLTIAPSGGDTTVTGNLAVSGTMSAATTTLATTTLSGPLLFSPDNTYDIGASGATRPRTGYYGTSLVVGSTATLTTNALNFSATSTMDLNNTALNIDSNTLYVDAANNRVGVGMNSPKRNLHIGGVGLPTEFAMSGDPLSNEDGLRFSYNPTAGIRASVLDTRGLSLRLRGDSAGNGQTEVMYLDLANGNIGIATTTPSARLHIVQPDAADSFRVDDVASDTSPFVIDQSGNVGVGTGAPQQELHVNGQVIIGDSSSYDSSDLYIKSDTPLLTMRRVDTNRGFSLTVEASTYGLSGQIPTLKGNGNVGGLVLDSGYSSAPMLFAIGGTEKVRISTDGNVGIGTTSPYARLSVEGSSALGNSALAGYFTATSTTATSTFAGKFAVGTSTPGASSLFTIGTSTPFLHVDNNTGFVGIGTAAPGGNLNIVGTASNSTASALVQINGINGFSGGHASGQYLGIRIPSGFAGNALTVMDADSSIPIFEARDGGSFVVGSNAAGGSQSGFTANAGSAAFLTAKELSTGIDRVTIAPASIQNSSDIMGMFSMSIPDSTTGTGGWTGIRVNRTGSGSGSGAKRLIDLQLAGVSQFIVDNAGNVGIGTTSPYARLSVEGSSVLGNSALAGYFTATSTTATSTFAGGLSLTGGGISPGFNFSTTTRFYQNGSHFLTSSTTAAGNLAVGYQTSSKLDESGGLYNTYLGYQAGSLATSTSYNTGVGYQALYNIAQNALGPTVSYNTALGYKALNVATYTFGNTAVGYGALDSLASGGHRNTAMGNDALSAQNAWDSVAVGYSALVSANANWNIGIGTYAGDNITTGGGNIIIGYNIDAPSATGSYQLNIGNLIFGTGIDGIGTTLSTGNIGIGTTTPRSKLSIHNSSLDTTYSPLFTVASSTASATTTLFTILNDRKVGIGTATPAYPLDVLGAGTGDIIARFNDVNSTGCTLATGGTISCSSDLSLKKNIEDISGGLDKVLSLHPILFNWKAEADSPSDLKNLGFIAQEVELTLPKLVSTESEGTKQLNTIGMIPLLTKAIQEQQGMIEGLRQTIASTTALADSSSAMGGTQFSGVVSQSFDWFLEQFKNIGIAVSDGAIAAREFIADKITARKVVTEAFEMKDSATGESYCVKITNGEWNKIKGVCGDTAGSQSSSSSYQVESSSSSSSEASLPSSSSSTSSSLSSESSSSASNEAISSLSSESSSAGASSQSASLEAVSSSSEAVSSSSESI